MMTKVKVRNHPDNFLMTMKPMKKKTKQKLVKFSPTGAKFVNCGDAGTRLDKDAVQVETVEGKNSAPMVTGVSRLSEGSDCILDSSCSIFFRLFKTLVSITESMEIMSLWGSGEAAGDGVEMFDICFLSCLNLLYLMS